jgi:2-dehydropantoate 2-reductase
MTLQNGLGNEDALAALFHPDHVMGGLCFVCLNRVAPGEILHTAHGTVVMGEYQRSPGPRLERVRVVFQNAGIPCRVTDNLDRAHWEKLVWNVPFNGLGVAGTAGWEAVIRGELRHPFVPGPTLPTDRLLCDPRWEQLVRELMFEIIATARALGYPLDDSLVDQNVARTRVMGAYKASTLIDFERRVPLEVNALFREPLRHARKTGVAAPRLKALCELLDQLERVNHIDVVN